MGARRIRFADVAAGLALVIAVATGGAYAASTLGKNTVRSKQVKNESLRGKDVKNDSLAGVDINESSLILPPGPRGATGPQGVEGQTGSTGPSGPLLETLPSGKTLRGVWMLGGQQGLGTPAVEYDAISFPIPLASDPAGAIRPVAAPPDARCPGSVGQPDAAPGYVCLYVAFQTANVSSMTICQPSNGGCGPTSAERTGVGIQLQSNATGNVSATGTWAVTAP